MELEKIEIPDSEMPLKLLNLKLLEEFQNRADTLTKSEVTYLKNNLRELLGIVPIKPEKITDKNFTHPFERMVINPCNKRINCLEGLRYPPESIKHKLNYNRASLEGQSIFYAGANGTLPVTVETKPQKGQLITISKWVLKENTTLNMAIICQDHEIALSNPEELYSCYQDYHAQLKRLQPNTRQIIERIYQLVIEAFTREVNPSIKQGYLFSALFANLFFFDPCNPVDAIYYPSVPNKGGAMNLAVKPDIIDSKFQMVEASEFVVVKNAEPGARIWHNFHTATCKQYDKHSLMLMWDDHIRPPDNPVNEIIIKNEIQFD